MDHEPLIRCDEDSCRECWGCVRHCPSKAIRIADGHTSVIEERCVRCGRCVTACGHHALSVRDDTDAVLRLLSTGRPVVALLATESVAALHPMKPSQTEAALEAMGFCAVESTLLGEELVARAYDESFARDSGLPVIRSTCPVVVEWVRRFHPSLTEALAPVVPPYVAQAALIRSVYPPETAVVYASPCWARKDEIEDPAVARKVDIVIGLDELRDLMDGVGGVALSVAAAGSRRPRPLKELSLTDGFPRRTMDGYPRTSRDVFVGRGVEELDRVLSAIEQGETAPRIIDVLECDGCIDGPAVGRDASVWSKRNIEMEERDRTTDPDVGAPALLKHLPPVEIVRTFRRAPVASATPKAEELKAVLAEGGFATHADHLDCGACGYETCVEHAMAIFRGASTWRMCFPMQRRRLDRTIERLSEAATVDALTGLWNRRVFEDRLADEFARYVRYGTPVSLLMLDLDAFKEVNDRHGHLVGDRVLAAVGSLLRDDVRATDIPTRYGGDEFAVILPGTAKTDAYAAAEKLRAGVDALQVPSAEGGYQEHIAVTASVGVASVSDQIASGTALMDAADRALYTAKQKGRDQVRIAPG